MTRWVMAPLAHVGTGPDGEEMWQNELYVVLRRRQEAAEPGFPDLVHLSIRRQDRSAHVDWRHFQQIKNQLLGPECEAMELYPAESRLVDSTNQYHLWGLDDPTFRFPFGFGERLVAEGPYTSRAQQRPWHPSERPPDVLSAAQLDAMLSEEERKELHGDDA